MKPEPIIIINNVELDLGQAMTMRVAIGSFISFLQEEGLGDGEDEKILTEAYLLRAFQIQNLMFKNLE